MITDGEYRPIERRSRFLNPWLIPIALLVGWGPLFAADLVIRLFPWLNKETVGEGFVMPWGMGVTLPTTAAAVFLAIVQLFRLLIDRASGPAERP